MMENNHIQINHLTIGYKEKGNRKVVATDINACLHSGELTCLLGTNGIGKSTLLRTLSGFQAPLEGEIILRGKPLSTYSDKELATLIGVVLTEKCELRNMTVEELVGMGRSPYTGFWGRLGKHDREVIEESIQLVGIGHLRYQMVHQLSDGERQKVMIAKALAQQTDIIFLDEPTAFLDFPSKVEIMQLLFRLSHTGNRTIFLSTHDLELALQIADKVWLMNKENGVKTGTPEDLSLDGSLSHFFLRKGIRFDRESGLFRIARQATVSVRLTGEGDRYTMVQKALARHGIEGNRQHPSDWYIAVTDEAFFLHPASGQTVQAATIEELLQAVHQLLDALPH